MFQKLCNRIETETVTETKRNETKRINKTKATQDDDDDNGTNKDDSIPYLCTIAVTAANSNKSFRSRPSISIAVTNNREYCSAVTNVNK